MTGRGKGGYRRDLSFILVLVLFVTYTLSGISYFILVSYQIMHCSLLFYNISCLALDIYGFRFLVLLKDTIVS